ncbi:diguanylate cyclase/phosphodiesterase with PAS/PAC sensor(s) [Burkholderia sp. lig30]|jgi:diguanylate cyclase (GGDEF)-like protein/PAS domain S-box-containing protein|uniref:EAL domain-containing protein n=1 Tax=Burkholderia sp. lig30 TaxID=1192124 RepID=UPI0004618319|nr:EAL domain-containing protein [Burkholderia sp. lig30]KDB09748.1 diguanylate cyclase/phosphodiesterase with PAS/PAC sensor(s) [Burkholderia sp. lig30]
MYPSSYDVPIARLVARQMLSCTRTTPVRDVARRIFAERCSSIVVVEDGKAIGIWTEQDALAAGDTPRALDRPIGEVMSSPVLTLEANTSLGEAAVRFKQSGVRHFVVVRDGAAIGVLSQTDVVLNQGAEFFLRLKSIESIRVHSPVKVPGRAALHDVVARMRAQKLDAVVVDYDDGEQGILTERDVVRLIAGDGVQGTVGEHASKPLQTLAAKQSLYAAQRYMVQQNMRHIGIHDDHGNLTGLLCYADVLQNIEHEYVNELRSALRERDEALGLARFNLRMADRVFESALEGIMVTDRHARIERVNQAFTRLTGYTEEEVVGRDPSLLSSGRQTPDFYKNLWHSLTTDGHWQGEIWNRKKTGELFLEYLTITSIRDNEGQISNYAAIFSDITQRRQAEERLGYLATHDVLTGLANRALFEERLERAIVHGKRRGRKVAVMYLDLDRFKLVNDTLGHNAGDEVLKVVAERVNAGVRASDTVARMGGDEFALVLEEFDDVRDVGRIARKLLDEVGRAIDIGGRDIFVTPSIGISIYPDDGTEAEQLMLLADQAMYGAKSRGRNVFQFFESKMTSSAMEQLETLGELHRALEQNEFCLFYQPQYDLTSGRIVGVEALLRWRHPHKGFVPPGDFIGLAEQSALIVPIGRWVLREACQQARRWLDDGFEFGRMAVNLSARQCFTDSFLIDLTRILSETALPPERLQLELLESMAMNTREEIGILLRELAGRGISLAIDDFGTGYSSLAYLKDLPVDTLKIDRSFLADSGSGSSPDGAIVRAIVAMGRALGLDVVMEGVETKEQLAFLQEIGCHQVQGFLLGRPQPAEQLVESSLSRAEGGASVGAARAAELLAK